MQALFQSILSGAPSGESVKPPSGAVAKTVHADFALTFLRPDRTGQIVTRDLAGASVAGVIPKTWSPTATSSVALSAGLELVRDDAVLQVVTLPGDTGNAPVTIPEIPLVDHSGVLLPVYDNVMFQAPPPTSGSNEGTPVLQGQGPDPLLVAVRSGAEPERARPTAKPAGAEDSFETRSSAPHTDRGESATTPEVLRPMAAMSLPLPAEFATQPIANPAGRVEMPKPDQLVTDLPGKNAAIVRGQVNIPTSLPAPDPGVRQTDGWIDGNGRATRSELQVPSILPQTLSRPDPQIAGLLPFASTPAPPARDREAPRSTPEPTKSVGVNGPDADRSPPKIDTVTLQSRTWPKTGDRLVSVIDRPAATPPGAVFRLAQELVSQQPGQVPVAAPDGFSAIQVPRAGDAAITHTAPETSAMDLGACPEDPRPGPVPADRPTGRASMPVAQPLTTASSPPAQAANIPVTGSAQNAGPQTPGLAAIGDRIPLRTSPETVSTAKSDAVKPQAPTTVAPLALANAVSPTMPQPSASAPTPLESEITTLAALAEPADPKDDPMTRIDLPPTETLKPDAIRELQRITQDHRIPRQIAEQLAGAARQGPDAPVEITLNPEELGRVRMHFSGADNTIAVVLTVERPETADLMRRHLAALEAEFRNLGYSDVSFSFSRDGARHQPSADQPSAAATQDVTQQDIPTIASPRPRAGPSGGMDLRL